MNLETTMFNKDHPYGVGFKWRPIGILVNLELWCEKNCQGTFIYQYTNSTLWFEKESDAMFFKLANRLVK